MDPNNLLRRLPIVVAKYALLGRVGVVLGEMKEDQKSRLVTIDDLTYITRYQNSYVPWLDQNLHWTPSMIVA